MVRSFDKIRHHFGVNRMAQVAALASLQDPDHIGEVVTKVGAARARITGIAREQGLEALPSATNFVAVDCGADGAFARRVLRELLAHDIFVRMPGVAPLDRCIRISAGTEADLDQLAAVLPTALAAARATRADPAKS